MEWGALKGLTEPTDATSSQHRGILRALVLGSHRLGNMEWFVQTPRYSFKNTLWHSILLVVFSLERCHFDSILFHTEWCANGA